MMRRKSKFWTFVFSFVPGAGHMYLGLLRQGTELMFLFFLSIFVLVLLDNGILGVFLPIIWFYAIFDAMSKASSEEFPVDEDIALVKWLRSEGPTFGNKAKWIGYGLIIFGSYMIVRNVVFPMFDFYIDLQVRNFIQSGFIALLLIAVGVKILLNNTQARKD